MLNYILPPIIIIASVAYLIVFLFRKAEQIPQGEIVQHDQDAQNGKKMNKIVHATSHFSLKVLERTMHRLKLMSLKFHNTSNDMFHSIREKRQNRARIQQEMLERNVQENSEMQQDVQEPVKKMFSDIASEKKVLRPMVSETVTRPQSAIARDKNQLEEALIKRIAVNPKDIEAYERLGDYYLETGSHQDSLECFKQVLRLSSTHHKARLRIKRLEKLMK